MAQTIQQIAKDLARLAKDLPVPLQDVVPIFGREFGLTEKKQVADTYVQVVTYSLFVAKLFSKDKPFTEDTVLGYLPDVSGALSSVFQYIFSEQKGHLTPYIDLLAPISVGDVFQDQSDPVIHFYEHFLEAYGSTTRRKHGVFYTPKSLVSYTVRNVHRLLQRDFGLVDGLASTDTWGDVAQRVEGLEIPSHVESTDTFVQILDPAMGTGTFLVELVDFVESVMKSKWCHELQVDDWEDSRIQSKWDTYVSEHLLPRLFGFEILPTPLVVAQFRLAVKLRETCYTGDLSLQLYHTDSLEPPKETQLAEFLGTVVDPVDRIKQNQRFTVLIGNPPYSQSSGKMASWLYNLFRGKVLGSNRSVANYLAVDGVPLKERNIRNVSDLYIRFFRVSHWWLEQTGCGIIGYVTNNAYLDGSTLRGVRWALLSFFDDLYVLDLHGNARKKETTPDGGTDSNVFGVMVGIAIGFFVKRSSVRSSGKARLLRADCWGTVEEKFAHLDARELDV